MKQELGIESPYLFVSYQHKAPLTPRYIQKIMKTFLAKTSSSCYTPHTLRHYYASRSIEKGANIKAIAVLLGHADVSTTLKMYCHISAQYLKQVFETLNPFSTITLPVEQMIKQRYELLVVDGRSTDGTRDVVRQFISQHPNVNVRLLDNPGRLSSRARNIGIRAACGRG